MTRRESGPLSAPSMAESSSVPGQGEGASHRPGETVKAEGARGCASDYWRIDL